MPIRLLSCLALALVGCAPHAPPLLRLEARGLHFSQPPVLSAGVTRLRLVNQDPVWHEASVVRFLDSTGTIATYLAAAAAGDEYPAFAQDIGGVALLAPGDSAEVLLPLQPGRYAVICWHRDHVLQGMSSEFEVAPARDPAASPPVARDSLVLADYRLSPIAPRAGRHLLYLQNSGPHEHELAILRLAQGKSLQDYLAWRDAGEAGSAPGRTIGGTAALAPGGSLWVDVPWERGEYLLICLLEDSTGVLHVHRGMQQSVTVSEIAGQPPN